MTPQEIARKVGETMFPVDVASRDTCLLYTSDAADE